MPSRHLIAQEIQKSAGQDVVRRKYLAKLAKHTKRDTLAYCSGFDVKRSSIPAAILSVSLEDIQGFMTSMQGLQGKALDLILHSPGGSLEAAEQIVTYLRSKYDHIRAIVPQNAMSAATMICCACDEIVMGKHSAIGPIDPQMHVLGPNNVVLSVPAHAILKDFETARQEVGTNPNLAGFWVHKFATLPPGYFNFCQQTIKLSEAKVVDWLKQYMFKGQDDEAARNIAAWLGNFDEHKTHGRPIGYDLALGKKLKVTRLEDDKVMQDLVLSVFHAVMATFETTQCVKFVENHKGKGHYVLAQTNAK